MYTNNLMKWPIVSSVSPSGTIGNADVKISECCFGYNVTVKATDVAAGDHRFMQTLCQTVRDCIETGTEELFQSRCEGAEDWKIYLSKEAINKSLSYVLNPVFLEKHKVVVEDVQPVK